MEVCRQPKDCMTCVYVFYFYLASCGPKGQGSGKPLPLRIAALFKHPNYKTTSHPQPLRAKLGHPYLLPQSPPKQKKGRGETKERWRGKNQPVSSFSLGRKT